MFQKHLPSVHWQGVETWSTGQGVPDMNGCIEGWEFWIENKLTSGYKVNFEVGQVAWIERRHRAGGRVFLAIRRKAPAGPRRGEAVDELWLFKGNQVRSVAVNGLDEDKEFPFYRTEGGPAKWNWEAIKNALTCSVSHYRMER